MLSKFRPSWISLNTPNRKGLISISTKPISCLIEKRIIVYGYCINILTFVITSFAVLYTVDWLIRSYYSKVGVQVTLSTLIEYCKCLAVFYLIAMSDRETYAKEKTGYIHGKTLYFVLPWTGICFLYCINPKLTI